MADKRNLQIVIEAKNNAQSQLNSLSGQLSKMKSGFVALAPAALAVGAGIAYLGGAMIKAAGEFEQTKVAFTTMLGSAEKANTLLRDLADFAAKTPFQLRDLETNAKLLLAFGIEAQNIIPSLTYLGNIAAGLNVPIEQIARAFGQVSIAGRLMGQDLLQFTNAGVPLISQLSVQFGKSTAEIKKMVEQGKIGFADVEKALKSLGSEGGRFGGLMEAQSRTFLGRVSNIQDAWDQFLRIQGSGLIVFAGMAIDELKKVLDWLLADAQGANIFGKTLYFVISALIALGQTGLAILKTLGAAVVIVIGAFVNMGLAIKAVFQTIVAFAKNVKTVFTGVGQAMTGDFKGAANTLSGVFGGALADTTNQMQFMSDIQGKAIGVVTNGFKDAAGSWKNLASLDGFEQATQKFGSLGNSITNNVGGGLSNAGGEAKKLSDALDNYADKAKSFAQSLRDAFDEVGQKIKEINEKIGQLNVQFSKDTYQNQQDFANAYVEQEQKVADMKKELEDKKRAYDEARMESVDGSSIVSHNNEVARLYNEYQAYNEKLKAEQIALDQHKTVEMAYINEVNEARRLAGLTEFERNLEALEKKKMQITEEYQMKLAAMQLELNTELAKQKKLQEIRDIAIKQMDKFLAEGQKMTVDSVNQEIKYWNQLADAVARAKAGKSSGFISADASVNARAGQTIPNINIQITGNNIVNKEGIGQLAKQVGDEVMGALRTAGRLSY